MSQYNQFSQGHGQNPHNMNMPPLQTNHAHMQGQPGQQRPYSPQSQSHSQSYQQSPQQMSPTLSAGGIPPAKRQRLSPGPASPAYSAYSTSPYANANSPYATSPPAHNNYLARPESPAMTPPMQSFNQPQPYQYANSMDQRPHPQGSLMPPPKVPYSKAQDNAELEKSNPRDMDVNNLSDVLTGSGIDLRAEEEAMFHYGASLNSSQASASTVSPHGSFNQWPQHVGAFQGSGPLSQPVTEDQLKQEFIRKHEQAARTLNQAAEQPLTDPFLLANGLRHRFSKRAYEQGVQLNLEGLFDKIPDTPREVTRTTVVGSNGESIVGLEANSILNNGAPFVELLSLVNLAAEERIRTIIEDAFALSQGRQNTSNGIVPPSLADIAVANGETVEKTTVPVNLSKTPWEAVPDSAVSPMTTTASKHLPNPRLPTPPSEAPPSPQPTIQVKTNPITAGLKRRVEEDERFERLRMAKRQKRLAGNSATPADSPAVAPLPLPEKLSKKERDREKKMSQTDDVLHNKANETAALAFGKKKKYAWMTGGTTSGASTPSRLNTAIGMNSGTATPAAAAHADEMANVKRRTFQGGDIEASRSGKSIQLRDLVNVLDQDGRERKTLAQIISRMRSDEKDEKKIQDRPNSTVPPGR
ncbi:hypothetical protein CC80DRAFT_505999 [Byssothecium circinans]|uniref:Transcription initiation factor TFIID subunit 4 n=1 Tax=Byssothecium circinans TaxID=147558 RepID=A0A6A5U0L9_9PLEO|nr:hypothetical protein CC80DRAFT_505999 [Byssothecium circinans]